MHRLAFQDATELGCRFIVELKVGFNRSTHLRLNLSSPIDSFVTLREAKSSLFA